LNDLFQAMVKKESIAVAGDRKKQQDEAATGDHFQASQTKNVIDIEGKLLRYTSRAGVLKIPDVKGKIRFHVFFVSHEKDDSPERQVSRPITFALCGGPGSSSTWLQMALMGPRRARMNSQGLLEPPPYGIEDNPATWLDLTDLVFIDPVGTGFSGFSQDEKPESFFAAKEDLQNICSFIRLYVTRFNRWLSPKFIAGEGYGSFRAAGLLEHLQQEMGIDVSGLILMSPVLDYFALVPGVSNDLPYALALPSFTAAAWHHGRLAPALGHDFSKTLREVENWAIDEYYRALLQGNRLSGARARKTAQKLSQYTGLPRSFVEDCSLRVSEGRFRKELLRQRGVTIGRKDARFTGADREAAGDTPEFDPADTAGPLVASFNYYAAKELGFQSDKFYHFQNNQAEESWSWHSLNSLGYPSVSETLRGEIHKNRYLHVHVACGYFDLSVPYFASRYAVSQLKLDDTLWGNVSTSFYHAGQTLHHPQKNAMQLKNDVSRFYSRTSTQEYKAD
jgi:carboxypeptidase C (cathepsin A)